VKIKALDIVIFCLSLLCVGWLAFTVYGEDNGVITAYIKTRDTEWYFPLEEDRLLTVDGPLGKTEIAIEDNSIRVISSPCPGKICVNSGPISKPGDWIACLPNQVFINIQASIDDHEKNIDSISY
jgi:hypothetical protein